MARVRRKVVYEVGNKTCNKKSTVHRVAARMYSIQTDCLDCNPRQLFSIFKNVILKIVTEIPASSKLKLPYYVIDNNLGNITPPWPC